jgi:hypothetical protein
MGSSRRLTWRCIEQRRPIGLAVLVSLCAALFPIPIGSQVQTDKDISEPFPCQNRPCGCKSAQQCWKKCCCFSNPQKLAWAKANRVIAPAYVAAAVKKEESAVHSAPSCCGKLAGKASQQGAKCPITSTRKCCATANAGDRAEDSRITEKSGSPTKAVVGLLMHQCQGHSWFWNSLPWAVVSEPTDTLMLTQSAGEFVVPLGRGRPQSSHQPPVPPPRYEALVAIYS